MVRIFSDLLRSRNVHEVSEIVDVFICQQIGMFHIAIDRNVRQAIIMECSYVCKFNYEYSTAFDNGLRACVSVIGKCSGSQDCGKMCINIIMECSLVSEIDGVDKDSTGSEKICIVQLLYIYSTLMFIGVRKV